LERQHVVAPSAFFEAEIARENGLDVNSGLGLSGLKNDPLRCNMAQEAMREAWYGMMALKFLAPVGAQISEKDYINQFLRYVIAHEFGHCLGLRHNFIASTLNSLDDLGNAQKVEA